MAALISLTIAGSIVTTGALALRKPKRKPLACLLVHDASPASQTKQLEQLIKLSYGRGQALKEKVLKKLNVSFFDELREQQMTALGLPAVEVSEAGKKARHNLSLATVSLGFATIGLFYPLAFIPSAIIQVYLIAEWVFRGAYQALVEERRITFDVVNAVFNAGALLGGLIFPAAVARWFLSLVQLLFAKTEDHSMLRISHLFGDQPQSVWLFIDENVEIEVPLEQVQEGDTVVVMAGQVVPVDGTIVGQLPRCQSALALAHDLLFTPT